MEMERTGEQQCCLFMFPFCVKSRSITETKAHSPRRYRQMGSDALTYNAEPHDSTIIVWNKHARWIRFPELGIWRDQRSRANTTVNQKREALLAQVARRVADFRAEVASSMDTLPATTVEFLRSESFSERVVAELKDRSSAELTGAIQQIQREVPGADSRSDFSSGRLLEQWLIACEGSSFVTLAHDIVTANVIAQYREHEGLPQLPTWDCDELWLMIQEERGPVASIAAPEVSVAAESAQGETTASLVIDEAQNETGELDMLCVGDLVLCAEGSQRKRGTPAVLSLKTGAPNERWRLDQQGRLCPFHCPYLALDLDPVSARKRVVLWNTKIPAVPSQVSPDPTAC